MYRFKITRFFVLAAILSVNELASANPLDNVFSKAKENQKRNTGIVSTDIGSDINNSQTKLNEKVVEGDIQIDARSKTWNDQTTAARTCADKCYSIDKYKKDSVSITCKAGFKLGNTETIFIKRVACYSYHPLAGGCSPTIDEVARLVCGLSK